MLLRTDYRLLLFNSSQIQSIFEYFDINYILKLSKTKTTHNIKSKLRWNVYMSYYIKTYYYFHKVYIILINLQITPTKQYLS